MTSNNFDEIWIRRKMGHLLLHLHARESWKLGVISETMKKKLDDDSFELKGITDHGWPCNWGITQEANTIAFILGKKFDGSFKEALEAIREFVYKQENTECSLQNNKKESPLKSTENSSSKPAQDQEKPTQS